MVGGIVADIYHSETRNMPMSMFAGSSLFGIGFGPLICGFVAQHTTWRWIFYFQSIIAGMICLSVLLFFPETRSTVVLRKKAKVLNDWYEKLEQAGYYGHKVPVEGTEGKTTVQRIRWIVAEDEGRTTLGRLIIISLYRPFKFLFTEPVVFFFSLWMAFSWAVLYMNISAVPMVFQVRYGFSLENSNAVFTSSCVACILATILAITQDRLAERIPNWNTVPEQRLYFSCVESCMLPIGLFMFGWTSEYGVHWIVPTIAIGINTVGIFSIYLAVFNYFADTYNQYASSTIAAQSFCRNMLGGAFPLVSRQLFHNLGYGPASSLLGGIAVLLTFVPWVLVFFGPTIRSKSKLASAMNDKPASEAKTLPQDGNGSTEV
ncbi:hypothetical protein MAP00_003528 [Monascus purpureus]|nr:hypothetical protein MAP00_003528 [Monascus purpureus]